MATLSSKIFKHHKKSDGTYNVKICVYHKGVRKFIDTEHYLTEKKLTKALDIKDPFINKLLDNTLEEYREAISRLGKRLDLFDAETLKDYLTKKDTSIDFIKFCRIHIGSLLQAGRVKSASNYRTVCYSLIDFFKREVVPIEEITIGVISSYERFLRSDRTVTRKNQHGKTVTIKCKGVSDASVHNYLRDFKGFFTAQPIKKVDF